MHVASKIIKYCQACLGLLYILFLICFLQGLVFHPIHFQIEEGSSCASGARFDQEPDSKIPDVIPSVNEDTDSVQEGGILSRKFAVVKNILAYSFGPIFHPYVVSYLEQQNLCCVLSCVALSLTEKLFLDNICRPVM